MAFCLDASLLLNWLLPQRSSVAVGDFLETCLTRGEQLVAPPLLFAEVTSVIRRQEHGGALLPQEADAALTGFLALPVSVVHTGEVYLLALDFARRLGHARAYDVQYLAVARLQDCPVATLDRGLYESARSLGIAARFPA